MYLGLNCLPYLLPYLMNSEVWWYPKAKPQLKDAMKVEVSKRSTKAADVIVLDGCAILWIVHWPENGKLLDYVTSFVHKVVSFYLRWIYTDLNTTFLTKLKKKISLKYIKPHASGPEFIVESESGLISARNGIFFMI